MVAPFVGSVIRKTDTSWLSPDEKADLRAAAEVGVWEALRRFDPERGVAFTTFMTPYVRAEVLDFYRGRQGLSVTRHAFKMAHQLDLAFDNLNGARKGRAIYEVPEAMLADLRVPRCRNGEVVQARVREASTIVRARASAIEVPEDDSWTSGSESAEAVFFQQQGEVLEVAVVDFVVGLADLAADAWPEAVAAFVSGQDLDADGVLTAAQQYHGVRDET